MNVNDNIDGAPTNHHHQQYKIDPAMKIGHVSLNVSNLSRSLDFYESILGFKRVDRPSRGKALLSVGDNNSSYLVELLQVNTTDANSDNVSSMNILVQEQDYITLQSCFLKESFWQIYSKI
jgi:catechol-2,3-dioxygenase